MGEARVLSRGHGALATAGKVSSLRLDWPPLEVILIAELKSRSIGHLIESPHKSAIESGVMTALRTGTGRVKPSRLACPF
jgi:hypothetical protein